MGATKRSAELVLRRLRPDVTLSYLIKPVIFGTIAGWLVQLPHRVAMIEGLGCVFTDEGKGLVVQASIAASRCILAV
jgi:hypothetical protein